MQAHGRLRVHSFDPNTPGHFPRIEELSKRIGKPAFNVCAIQAGERLRLLKLRDLAAYDEGAKTTESMQRPTLAGFRDEEAIAQAILSVTETKSPKVAFLRGHGERAPDVVAVGAAGVYGLSKFVRGLSAQNYTIVSLGLSEGKPLTKDDVDVVVVAEPVKQFAAHEVATLVTYAKAGGNLLLLLHPDSATSLDFALLNEVYGLTRTLDPVCQETQFERWHSAPNSFEVDKGYSEHPIVKPLRAKQLRTHWEKSSGFTALGRMEQTDVELSPLVWTANSAWVDLAPHNLQYDPKAETKATQFLGYAAQLKSGGRMVCYGCATIFDDGSGRIEATPSDRDLGLNSVD